MTDFAGLSIEGRVATRGDWDWDDARRAFNLAVDQHPCAVAFVEGVADISRVIRFAADRDLKVTAQGTGHGALPLAPLDDTILIKTERLRKIELDAGARTARLEAGVLAQELGAAAQAKGLCSLPGTSPVVGAVGYTLGGGWNWLAQRYGFACNHVKAIELVAADGEPRRVDGEHDADLFWALRGGGGSYAIVTAIEVELFPIAELYAGMLVLPAEVGATGIRAYRDWAEAAPDEVTSIVRFLRPPHGSHIPEAIRDRPVLTMAAVCIGDEAEGQDLVAPLREIGEPIIDTFAQVASRQLSTIHMDPAQPVPALGHHALLREFPDDAIDVFVELADPAKGSPLLLVMLRQGGGAAARAPENAGALDRIDAAFAMNAVGVPTTPELGAAISAHLDRLHGAMRPWAAPGGFLNMSERPAPLEEILPPDTSARLAEVKRRWDPDGLIRANHELEDASTAWE
jgi:FAD/FMN-containing dehydrogenase